MLNQTQLAALAAAIAGQSSLADAVTNHDATVIKNFYNAVDTPAWIVWRTKVTRTAAMMGMDWTRVDNLSVGKARIWDWMFNDAAGINAADTSVRAGIDAVWVGTAADLAVRATVYANCQRNATKGEHLLSSGTGTAQSPATMGYEGDVHDFDVQQAMGW